MQGNRRFGKIKIKCVEKLWMNRKEKREKNKIKISSKVLLFLFSTALYKITFKHTIYKWKHLESFRLCYRYRRTVCDYNILYSYFVVNIYARKPRQAARYFCTQNDFNMKYFLSTKNKIVRTKENLVSHSTNCGHSFRFFFLFSNIILLNVIEISLDYTHKWNEYNGIEAKMRIHGRATSGMILLLMHTQLY